MAAIVIRNLSPATHRALRARAAQHGRSTEAEARAILDDAVRPEERVKLSVPHWRHSEDRSANSTSTFREIRPWQRRSISDDPARHKRRFRADPAASRQPSPGLARRPGYRNSVSFDGQSWRAAVGGRTTGWKTTNRAHRRDRATNRGPVRRSHHFVRYRGRRSIRESRGPSAQSRARDLYCRWSNRGHCDISQSSGGLARRDPVSGGGSDRHQSVDVRVLGRRHSVCPIRGRRQSRNRIA